MDKQEAKFILQSFRPDGADASSADFAEALTLAASDRELGEWLADERAADAEFAAALGGLEIPEQLRQSILAVMRGEHDADPELDAQLDAAFQGGLADLEPPEGLRDQILTAMHVQAGDGKVTAMPTKKHSPYRKLVYWGAVAAALVLGVFLALQVTTESPSQRLASYEVQQAAGELLNAKFQFDRKSEDLREINTWLVGNNLPAAAQLPERLRNMKSMGCKKITLPGDKEASMVCFLESEGRSLHLIIIANEHVADRALPTMDKVMKKDCYHCSKTDWDVVRWRDEKHTYILMARNKETPRQEDALLRYF